MAAALFPMEKQLERHAGRSGTLIDSNRMIGRVDRSNRSIFCAAFSYSLLLFMFTGNPCQRSLNRKTGEEERGEQNSRMVYEPWSISLLCFSGTYFVVTCQRGC